MNQKSKVIEIKMGLSPINAFDNIENNNIEISIQSNKKPISFIDTMNNNNAEYLDYAGGLDEENLKNGFGIQLNF